MSHFDSAQYRSMTRTNVMPPPSEPKPPARMARLKELIAAGHQPSAAMAISEREDKHRPKLPEIVRQKPPAGGSTVRKAIIARLTDEWQPFSAFADLGSKSNVIELLREMAVSGVVERSIARSVNQNGHNAYRSARKGIPAP